MSNDDFDDGYNRGKRAVRKTAGWFAGLGAAILGPVADKASDAARSRALQKAQHQAAFDHHTDYLQSQLELARQSRKPPWRIRHWSVVAALGICGAWLGYRIHVPTIEWGYVALFAAVVGAVLGAIIVEGIRNSEWAKARDALNQHIASRK